MIKASGGLAKQERFEEMVASETTPPALTREEAPHAPRSNWPSTRQTAIPRSRQLQLRVRRFLGINRDTLLDY
jgi:hypothetical protein